MISMKQDKRLFNHQICSIYISTINIQIITTKFRFLRGSYRDGYGCEQRIKESVQGLFRMGKRALVWNGFKFCDGGRLRIDAYMV